MDTIKIAPSILAANFGFLSQEVASVKNAGADLLHVDIMDGHFVPNLSIGTPVVESLKNITDLFLDVHLMVTDPIKYGEVFYEAGADGLTFHIEVCTKNTKEIIKLYKSFGVKVGVALNPDTPAESIKDIIEDIDLILVMTVYPGFGGQKFIKDCLPKIKKIKEWILESGKNIDLEVDGGINIETAPLAKEAGANLLVAGTSVFKSKNQKETITKLRN